MCCDKEEEQNKSGEIQARRVYFPSEQLGGGGGKKKKRRPKKKNPRNWTTEASYVDKKTDRDAMYCGWCDQVLFCWRAELLWNARNQQDTQRERSAPPAAAPNHIDICFQLEGFFGGFFFNSFLLFCLFGWFFVYSLNGRRRREQGLHPWRQAAASSTRLKLEAHGAQPSYCCSHSAAFAEQCVTPFTRNLRIFRWESMSCSFIISYRMCILAQPSNYINLRKGSVVFFLLKKKRKKERNVCIRLHCHHLEYIKYNPAVSCRSLDSWKSSVLFCKLSPWAFNTGHGWYVWCKILHFYVSGLCCKRCSWKTWNWESVAHQRSLSAASVSDPQLWSVRLAWDSFSQQTLRWEIWLLFWNVWRDPAGCLNTSSEPQNQQDTFDSDMIRFSYNENS